MKWRFEAPSDRTLGKTVDKQTAKQLRTQKRHIFPILFPDP